MKHPILFAGMLALAAPAFAQTTEAVPSMPLETFQQSLGVNTHINYTDGNYANIPNLLSDLTYLGISNVRDSLPNPGYDAPNADSNRQQVAAAGVKFDFLTTCSQTLAIEKQGWDEYATRYKGSILSIEGTNEINNQPCPGGTQAAAVLFQQGIYAAVHGDSAMQGVAVLDFTGGTNETGSMAHQADVLNTHPYPAAGQQPYARLMSDFSSIYGSNYGKYPTQITETGYQNYNYQGNLTGMDQLSIGEMGGNIFFDSALQGNTKTYYYQLLQAYGNVQVNGDTAYGLFDYFNQPTDLAVFLHNLHTMLPPDSVSTAKGNINVVLSTGLPSTAHMLALTASSSYQACPGCVIIFGWDEQPEFNTTTQENEEVAPLTGFVQLPGYTAVGVVFPGYPAMQAISQAGTYQGQPYYTATLFGFVTGIAFKPVVTPTTVAKTAGGAELSGVESLLHSGLLDVHKQ